MADKAGCGDAAGRAGREELALSLVRWDPLGSTEQSGLPLELEVELVADACNFSTFCYLFILWLCGHLAPPPPAGPALPPALYILHSPPGGAA